MSSTVIISLVVGGVVGGVVASVFRQKLRTVIQRVGRGRMAVAVLFVVLSGLFAYPAVHEYGHCRTAKMLGGEIESVHWTALAPEGPRVQYGYMPAGAGPWATAMGVYLPLGVAWVLTGVWVTIGHRAPWAVSMAILMPAALFLVATAGSLVELLKDDGHLADLAAHLGMGKGGEFLLYLIPTVLSIGGIGMLAWRIRRESRRADTAEDS